MSEDPSGIFTCVQQGQAGKKKYPGRKKTIGSIYVLDLFFQKQKQKKDEGAMPQKRHSNQSPISATSSFLS
jgi:hypothetical protein